MQLGKKFLSVIMSAVLVVGLMPAPALAAGGEGSGLATGVAALSVTPQALNTQSAGTVTRAEWLSKLVETFDITVTEEDEYPEDYFSDLESTNAHYLDVLKAVDFGIVDVAAGDPVYPDSPATREFAAQTLNFCLGFQLDEGAGYTYADTAETEYDDDLQVAVNRGWFALSGGKVLPAQNITAAESSKMLADASEVLASVEEIASAPEEVRFAAGVKEVPEGANVSVSDDGKTVTIVSCPIAIAAGDRFAVYLDGMPAVYLAKSVNVTGNSTVVSVEAVEASEAFASYVYSDEDEFDMSKAEAAEDVTTKSYNTIEEAARAEKLNVGGLRTQGISWKNGTLSFDKKWGAANFSGVISNMKMNTKANVSKGQYYVSLSGKASLTASVKGKIDASLPCVGVWSGVWKSELKIVVEATGSMSKTIGADFEIGAQYDKKNGFRLVKNFKKGRPGVTAKASARVGYEVSVTGQIPALVEASVGAGIGFSANYVQDNYSDGKTPRTCQDASCFVYAEGFARVKFGPTKRFSYERTFPIWSANNSPVRMHKHWEDGREVGSCSRGKHYTCGWWPTGSGSYFGSKWGHLMNGDGGSANGWGYNDAGEWVEYATYEYELDDANNATITKYYGNTRALIVPDTLDGYPVVGIGGSSFEGNTYLIAVQLPESITVVADYAFAYCPQLSDVALPGSLKSMGSGAFQDDDSISSVTVPAALEECATFALDVGPFADCDGLKEVKFAAGATRVASGLLRDCTGIESVVVPDGVVSVDYEAFYGCSKLVSVSLPNTLKSMAGYTFAYCSSLTKLVIPDSVETMGENTCMQCTSLVEAHIPSIRKSLMKATFSGCSSLSAINLPDTLNSIQDEAFYGCKSLENIAIPQTVTSVGASSFYDCDSLKSIELSNNVTSLGSGAFYDCDALSSVVLGTGVTTIPWNAFYHCGELESITLPFRTEKIDSNAFADCTKLVSVTIPRATTSIADNAFSYPAKMTIYGVAGTAAETYANGKSIRFVAQDIPATSIKLSQSELTMLKWEERTVAADIQPMNFTGEVTWKSSNTAVATVDQSGKITAQGTGDTVVKLVVGEQAAAVKVHVVQPVTSVSVSPYSLSLEGGETSKLTASVYPSDSYNKVLEWSSSDTSVATVDKNGKVTAVKKGTARITATAKDGSGRSDYANVTVTCNVTKATAVGQLESPHPYEKNCTDVWTYTVAGASALDVTFDKRTATEEGSDYIRIYTGGKVLVASYTGSALAGKTVKVPGNTVRVKLESDAALNDWGFKVTSVKASSLAISGATVSAIASRAYNGKAYNPKPTVKYGKATLKLGTDYTVSYLNASKKAVSAASVKAAGAYYVKITGKGKYSGTKNVAFKVTKAANPMSVAAKAPGVKYSKKAQTVAASKAYTFKKKAVGTVTYARVASGSSKWLPAVNKKTGAITVKAGAPRAKTQAVKVKVTAAGNGNYKSASKTVTVKVKVK